MDIIYNMPILTSSIFMITFYIINTALHIAHLMTARAVQELPHAHQLHSLINNVNQQI